MHYAAGFPEHSHKVLKLLIDLGFGDNKIIYSEEGKAIKTLDFTREILKIAKHPKNYRETENVWLIAKGIKDNKEKIKTMECITSTLKGFEDAGSNINTGMTISIMAQLLFQGKIKEIGVTAPEVCVPHEEFFTELAKRKIIIYEDNKRIN